MKEYLTELKGCYKFLLSREFFFFAVETYGPFAILHPVVIVFGLFISPFIAYHLIDKSK